MFKNYLKIALRTLRKNKVYSLINILGLALGLMVSILVFLYTKQETSYEKHFADYDRIYRVGITGNMMGQIIDAPVSCSPMATSLRKDFGEVEIATRMRPVRQEIMLSHEDQKIYIPTCIRADSFFFRVFNYKFIHGDPQTALNEANAIVLTESTAQKFFGDSNPMNKILRYDDRTDRIVRGVIREPNPHSHFHGDFFIPEHDVNNLWISNNYYTYVKLRSGTDVVAFRDVMAEQFINYLKPNAEEFLKMTVEELLEAGNSYEYDLQPISEVHLHSHRNWEFRQNGNIMYVYVFIAIAFLVLLIAGINFMNLSTARSSKRAKEVGIRKVSGATRSMLITQFMIESVIQSFIALFIAFILVELFLPGFNNVLNSNLSLLNKHFPQTALFAGLVTLVYGIFSGSYPAFFLSSFQPSTVLKGDMTKTKQGLFFRKSLVVIQFTASIVLIIGMAIIFKQISFMHNKDLGFNGDQVLVVPIQTDKVAQNFREYRQEFLKHPNVESISRSSYLPGDVPNQNMFRLEGSEEPLPFWNLEVDYGFFNTLNLQLIEGRNFDEEIDSDSVRTYILNETALKSQNIENPIGKRLSPIGGNTSNDYGIIVGIVKDFHVEGFNQEIKPMVLSVDRTLWWASIKVSGDQLDKTINFIENKWSKIEPSHPFRYTFLDENFAALYKQQENFGRIFFYLTLLAILISCMGLYGLASFTTEQRIKEIGIRKVLGASIAQLIGLLTIDFIKLVLIANLFAWPVSLLLARNWLSGFSYQIDMPILPFVLATLLAVVIAMATVSYQAYVAANSDPVHALKYE